MKLYKIKNNLFLSNAIDNYNKLGNIDAVINCRAEQHDDVCELTKRNIAYYWIPIVDGHAPTFTQIDVFLDVVFPIQKHHNILVHCDAGRGRSVTMVMALLMFTGKKMSDAWHIVKKSKKDISLTELQTKKLKEYSRRIKK